MKRVPLSTMLVRHMTRGSSTSYPTPISQCMTAKSRCTSFSIPQSHRRQFTITSRISTPETTTEQSSSDSSTSVSSSISILQPAHINAPAPAASTTNIKHSHEQQPLHSSIRTLYPLLRAQPSHYITAHIHARPYLVMHGDTVRLPFRMPDVLPGDVLRLTRALNLGSRDYTLKGAPYVDDRLFECRARVIGLESEPMRVELKTKRRQRRVKRVKSKHKYTILKIAELKLLPLEELPELGV